MARPPADKALRNSSLPHFTKNAMAFFGNFRRRVSLYEASMGGPLIMRKMLFTSSAIAALLIATSYAAAQAPDQKRDEPKAERSEKAKPPQAQAPQAQEQQRGAQEHRNAQPEPKGAASQQPASKPTTGQAASEPAKTEQKAEQKSEPKADQRKAAEDSRKAAEEKRQSEKKSEPARNNAERAQQDKSKSTAAPAQNERKGAAAPDQQKDQPKGAASQQQDSKPATAQSPTPSTNAATSNQRQPSSASTTTANQPAATATTTTQIQPQQKVRISESISRTKLAPPVRNLNVSINIGTVAPPRVRFQRLPREVWSIEPRYRNYDYFTTEEDIVIIEPRSRRVVDLIPRDPSRARAQVSTTTSTSSGGSMAQAPAGGMANCQVMKRDPSSGQLTEVRPDQSRSTTGSGSSANSLAVTVQTGGGQATPPVALDAPAGQIVVATQGNGDCQITIEPQPRR